MKKKIASLVLVFVLTVSMSVQASEIMEQNTETNQTENVGDESPVDEISNASYSTSEQISGGSAVYTTQADGTIICYTPIVASNYNRIMIDRKALDSFTYSKSATYKYNEMLGFNFDDYPNSETIKNIKEFHVIAKQEEIPANINDGIEIVKVKINGGYFSSLNDITYSYKNMDILKNLENGEYYLRVFIKDVNNIYSVQGGLFQGTSSTSLPKIIITD